MLNFGLRVGAKVDLVVALEAKQFNSEPAFAQLKYFGKENNQVLLVGGILVDVVHLHPSAWLAVAGLELGLPPPAHIEVTFGGRTRLSCQGRPGEGEFTYPPHVLHLFYTFFSHVLR